MQLGLKPPARTGSGTKVGESLGCHFYRQRMLLQHTKSQNCNWVCTGFSPKLGMLEFSVVAPCISSVKKSKLGYCFRICLRICFAIPIFRFFDT